MFIDLLDCQSFKFIFSIFLNPIHVYCRHFYNHVIHVWPLALILEGLQQFTFEDDPICAGLNHPFLGEVPLLIVVTQNEDSFLNESFYFHIYHFFPLLLILLFYDPLVLNLFLFFLKYAALFNFFLILQIFNFLFKFMSLQG